MEHALSGLDCCEDNLIGDLDLAYCYEAAARAAAVAGDADRSKQWIAKAMEASSEIEDEETKMRLLADLETIQN